MNHLQPTLAGRGHDVLVGHHQADDAAVVRVPSDGPLVLTTDVIAPLVDEADVFGRIAAANALSDVYAMGGQPSYALNLAFFPRDQLPNRILVDILNGATATCRQADVAIVGGHTVVNPDLKYGLAVVGSIATTPWSNDCGRAGQHLVLSKALGTGMIGTAVKKGQAEPAWRSAAVASMTTLNREASAAGRRCGVSACTDVTGFGLLGHLHNLARASRCAAEVLLPNLPILPGTIDCVRSGHIPGGTRANLRSMLPAIRQSDDVDPDSLLIAADAQTSGGLLMAVDADSSESLVDDLRSTDHRAAVIGQLVAADTVHRPGDLVVRN